MHMFHVVFGVQFMFLVSNISVTFLYLLSLNDFECSTHRNLGSRRLYSIFWVLNFRCLKWLYWYIRRCLIIIYHTLRYCFSLMKLHVLSFTGGFSFRIFSMWRLLFVNLSFIFIHLNKFYFTLAFEIKSNKV